MTYRKVKPAANPSVLWLITKTKKDVWLGSLITFHVLRVVNSSTIVIVMSEIPSQWWFYLNNYWMAEIKYSYSYKKKAKVKNFLFFFLQIFVAELIFFLFFPSLLTPITFI